jgi:glutamine synthetase
MCAITNPTVNSYKRINAPRTLSGATWSPSSITYGGNNRTHMVRIPDAGSAEYRLPDGAANPYLLLASTSPSGSVTQRWTVSRICVPSISALTHDPAKCHERTGQSWSLRETVPY